MIFLEKKYILINPDNVISKEIPKTEEKPAEPIESLKEDDDDDNDHLETELNTSDIVTGDDDQDDIQISISDLEDQHKETQEELQSKLKKTLDDLQDIKKDMTNTFTSTETISSTITSLRGMIDALRKDQLQVQESMRTDETMTLDPKKNIQKFKQAQETMIKMGENVMSKTQDSPPALFDEVKERVLISKEWLKRADNILKNNDISKALKDETKQTYSNKTDMDKFVNKVWFDSLKFWLSLIVKMN